MTNYRRQFVPGGTYFFIVNLAERRPSLLTEHIDALRAALILRSGIRSRSTPSSRWPISFHRIVWLGPYPED